MANIELFTNAQFGSVRFIPEGDSFFVVGKDVLRALGYAESSTAAQVFASVPEEWKGIKPIDTLGGEQQMLCLSEQGLYFFLGRSDKPAALPYQKWIAGEVVPSIRKTGMYAMPKDFPSALRAYADAIEREKAEREAKLAAQAALKEKTETLAIVSNELEIANDQLGYAREFRSCIALADELAVYFEIQYKDFAGDSFYAQLGKFMTRLCKGMIVPGKTFEINKEYVPNARYNWINVYSIAAWDYFFNMCQTGQVNASTKFIGNFWRGRSSYETC